MIFGEGPIIKNIAGDLNKLFLQGTRAGQPILNVEGDAAADQGTVQLMADRDPVIRDISTGLGWARREVTVSGTGALQLVNSLGRPLTKWRVELAPYQEGSGDPSPENVRPIHGTSKINVITSGVNLIDLPDKTTQGQEYVFNLHNIWNLPAGTYTLQYDCPNSSAISIAIETTAGDKPIGNGLSGSFTVTGAIRGIRWYSSVATSTSNIMLNFGATALPYQPYMGHTQTEITLPQIVYDGTVGSDGGESRWGEVDLGTLNWTIIDNDNAFLARDLPINAATWWGINQLPAVMCQRYKPETWNNTKISVTDFAISAYDNQVRCSDSRYTNVADFKTAVSGVKLYYELATPNEFAVITPTIPTTEGDGSIWITAEDGIVTSFSATYLQGE